MSRTKGTRSQIALPGPSPRRELHRAMIVMAATLGTFGSALVLERISHQNLSIVILSVVLALSLARRKDGIGGSQRLLNLVVLPLIAVGAGTLGQLVLQRPDLGAVVFTIAISGSMALRQFGPRVARIGALITLPVTSILVVPAIGLGTGAQSRLWEVAAALLALAWVTVTQSIAHRLGVLRHDPSPATPTVPAASRRTSAHTRMALQLAIAVAAAVVIGRTAFPAHWNWTVLTAIIVCGGGPSRGEVVCKGAARLFGAGLGTMVATLVATSLPGHDDVTVVLIFVLLFLGTWWREIHYAAWTACMTCVMALLNSFVGQSGGSLLATRLLAIAVGAACATVVCCLVFPTPTAHIVRRRRAQAMRALGELAHGIMTPDPGLPLRADRFEARVVLLGCAARPLLLQQALLGRFRPPDPHLLSTVDALMACIDPARRAATDAMAVTGVPGLEKSAAALAGNVGRTRRALAGAENDDDGFLVVDDPRLQQLNEAVLSISQPRG